MVAIKFNRKLVLQANYSDHLGLDLNFTNHTEKNIKAIQEVLVFKDLFDNIILQVRITLEKNILAGQTVRDNDHSIELNKFMQEHTRLRTVETENLKVDLEVLGIIFTDGSILKC